MSELGGFAGINNYNNNGNTEEAELSESELSEIANIRRTPMLYHKMVESICPTVYDTNASKEIKRGQITTSLTTFLIHSCNFSCQAYCSCCSAVCTRRPRKVYRCAGT